MKKEKKVVYGIEIVRPWSMEMYNHNEEVAEIVREEVHTMWVDAMTAFGKEFDYNDQMLEAAWSEASEELVRIQTAVTCYGFGYGYDVNRVAGIVGEELEDAPFYRLNEIADELGIELKKGFVGFN